MKTPNKILIVCFLVLGIKDIKAQEAATAAGGNSSGLGGTAAYSVGQVSYTSISSVSGSADQGVQQPYTITPTGANISPDIDLQISAYPNPSTAFINLRVENQDLTNLSFRLFDAQGKLLINQKITSAETSIVMDEFASGNYFLKIVDSNSELKTFKINKN